ncbi:hypothetical protein KY343_02570 [Candidatus Woesearchaeota archaeon]|nr:hypothetical protein [Candidatus Woesearchaeota archaeon]
MQNQLDSSRFDLELLLEGGLYVLDAPLQRRVYRHELLVGGQIDAEFDGVTIHDLLMKYGLSNELMDELRKRGISHKKVEDWFFMVPYFRRTSSEYHGLNLEYNLYQCSVKGRFSQDIKIYRGYFRILTVFDMNNVANIDISERLLENGLPNPSLNALKELDNKVFDSYVAYRAVMDFFKHT